MMTITLRSCTFGISRPLIDASVNVQVTLVSVRLATSARSCFACDPLSCDYFGFLTLHCICAAVAVRGWLILKLVFSAMLDGPTVSILLVVSTRRWHAAHELNSKSLIQ